MSLVINKKAHCPIEIVALECTDTKPARYRLSISDNVSKTYSQPSMANNFEEELAIVLEKFHDDLGRITPKSFTIHPVKKGWIAIEDK